MNGAAERDDALAWLLTGEPAIRWQALRDLTSAPPAALAIERSRVAHEGLGARILDTQRANGAWARDGKPDWLPTLFSLQLLRATGVDPHEPRVVHAMTCLQEGFRWHESLGGKSFFDGETEPCINGGALAIGAYFGRPNEALVQRLLSEQLDDGGWNCENSPRASFHTTICVLEGLLEYERATRDEAVRAARQRGEAYLLHRHLVRRASTGALAFPSLTELAFPPRYHYDLLRGLDHLRAAGDVPDARILDALTMLESRATQARWPLDRSYTDSIGCDFDEVVGAPSRWNTLRALRVLAWAQSLVR